MAGRVVSGYVGCVKLFLTTSLYTSDLLRFTVGGGQASNKKNPRNVSRN